MNKNKSDNNRLFFEEFCKRLHSPSDSLQETNSLNFFSSLKNCDRKLLSNVFGDIGTKIFDFIESIDLDHPDAKNCYEGLFQDSNEFSILLKEFLSVFEYIEKNNFSKVQDFFVSNIQDYLFKNNKEISRIDIPEKNRCNVRLVADKNRCEKIRSQKKMQIVDLHGAYKKGMSYYNNHPDNFYKYLRFDNSLLSELKKMESKADRYDQLGCQVLADEIRKNLSAYQDHTRNTYYGFNRITMSSASIILARSCDFEMKIDKPSCEFTPENFRINVHKSYLGNVKILSDYNIDYFEYEPVIYPINEVKGIMTANVRNVLNVLDNFPEAKNKTIFDFYGIIVPSIKLICNQSSYAFVDSYGVERKHQIYNECKIDFDRHMIESGIFCPIIVAEKDHKCYFITYWL